MERPADPDNNHWPISGEDDSSVGGVGHSEVRIRYHGRDRCPDLGAGRLEGADIYGTVTAVTATAGVRALGCAFTTLSVIQIHLVRVVRRPTDRPLWNRGTRGVQRVRESVIRSPRGQPLSGFLNTG